MLRTRLLPVRDLAIDLNNFRTVVQPNELEATKAMISISPDYFWGLMESLLEDGYLPTENIVVLENSSGKYDVKEGNRRVASIKIMLGLIDKKDLGLPQQISDKINGLPKEFISAISAIPCAVYQQSEASIVDKIVANTHGKAEKAGRDAWEAVARARHNRDKNGQAETALDLLEKYLLHATNCTQEQKDRWAGKYRLTVLDEAIKRIATRFSVQSSPDLVRSYLALPLRKQLDDVIYAIGMETLTFPGIRESDDFALRFGIPPLNQPPANTSAAATATSGGVSGAAPTRGGPTGGGLTSGAGTNPNSAASNNSSAGAAGSGGAISGARAGGRVSTSATNDEKSVRKSLRELKLYGPNRAKIDTLRKEMLKLKLQDNPIAFCFLLRSVFEISAKVYCQDHASQPNSPKAVKADGNDRSLSDVLRGELSG